jgi:hypothetical protein
VNVNSTYTFTPAANDADGDQLSFQIQNKPSWATFSTSTGQLSGTPTLANAGAYANIIITVSDGKAQADLPAFSINVVAPTTGAATLSWTPPTQKTDGSTLTDLAGFTVVYGTSSTALTQSVQVANPSINRYVVEQLAAGTYYFAIKAYTASGTESQVSNIVSKVIQ